MKLNEYLDSTYLKLPEQSGLNEEDTRKVVKKIALEAIAHQFKLIMIRPNQVAYCKSLVLEKNATTLVGTVIGFHQGTASIESKLIEAQKAIEDGADELDFVINYTSFLEGDSLLVREEVLKGTQLAIHHNKVIKWIIEIAALNNEQIAEISKLIRDVVVANFGNKIATNVFIKSSTGFYVTQDNKPNGATLEGMQIIKKNAGPLSIKAAGGVRTYADAEAMIKLGVTRIGTSAALDLIQPNQSSNTASY